MSFYEVVYNLILVSIPEEFFIAWTALLLMGRYDYFDKYTIKSSIEKTFFVVVLPCVIIFSFNIYYLNLNYLIRASINLMVFHILISILTKNKILSKNIVFSMAPFIIIIILELTIGFILKYVFVVDISMLNSSPWINFLVTVPGRLLQFSFIYIIYLNKNSVLRINLLKIWSSNRFFRIYALYMLPL